MIVTLVGTEGVDKFNFGPSAPDDIVVENFEIGIDTLYFFYLFDDPAYQGCVTTTKGTIYAVVEDPYTLDYDYTKVGTISYIDGSTVVDLYESSVTIKDAIVPFSEFDIF